MRQRSASPSASLPSLLLALPAAVQNERFARFGVVCRSWSILPTHYKTPLPRRAERGQIQRDWIAASAESGRQAREALAKAAEVLAENIPGRRPDAELAQAWAEVAQGWASLSHAEAVRSIAAAAFAVDQGGVNTFPSS